MHRHRWFFLVAGALVAAASLPAQTLDSLTRNALRWRTVGPGNFEGRVTDIDGIPGSATFFVAAAAGGVWKTTNGGVTFRPVFDTYPCASTGAIAIAPSDTSVVYLGTGEPNSRNSIEPGCGMFKSTDGGLTWRAIGLERTQHIGRIVVHPTNPNVLYVAALGPAWKSGGDRGLYKSTDGGTSWQLIKAGANPTTGFIDVQMHPTDPNTLLAASWERIRGPYFLKSGGVGSALWKTTDGGATWTEVRGGGWPETVKGRISPRFAPSNPSIIYAMVEADSVRGRPSRPGQTRQQLANGLYRSEDGGATWTRTNPANTRPFYYSQVRVHPRNPNRVWFSSTPVLVSNDGGRTTRTTTVGLHVDHHAHWIDPTRPDYQVVGNDGGIGITHDDGGAWQFGGKLPLAQPYEVSYDFRVPYNICGGMQDNGSWCGPSRRKSGSVTNAHWFNFNGGDGFFTAQHPTEPWILFAESQGGNMARFDMRTGIRTPLVKPAWRPVYLQHEDSILVTRGDTARPPTREQQRRIDEFRARQRADSAQLDMRWNWNTPYFLSPHNPNVLYAAGNRVVKSTQRGDNLFLISPDLSKKQYARIDTSMRRTGGITLDATGAETYGTVVSLAESPMRPGYLWAGTDDGNVWFTRTDGAQWEQIPAGRFAGLPAGDVYVTRIEPSRFDSLTAYVAFDNHRWNDFAPYLYVTTDAGRTFRSLASNLPKDGVDNLRVVREDPSNRDLLYVGTARGVYVSLDRGGSWSRFMTGLPTVPVYDLQVHPRDRELIAATHGRGFWIVDVAPLQQLGASVLAKSAHLFAPRTAFEYADVPNTGLSYPGSSGHNYFEAPSPPHGAEITYRLASTTRDTVQIIITNAAGETVRTLNGSRTAGVHKVVWDLRGAVPRRDLSPAQRRDSALAAQRASFVLDSLEKSGKVPAPVIRSMRAMASGQLPSGFGGGGGGGGGGGNVAVLTARLGPGGVWQARPGEGGQQGGGGGGGGGAAAMAAAFGGLEEMQAAFPGGFQEIQALFQVPGRADVTALGGGGGGGGGGFGNQAPIVSTGDYVVTLRVGNETQRQVLRVEHVGPAFMPVVLTP